MMKSTTLFNSTLEDDAIKLIQEYEPKEEYWVAFSGGKDSMVILDLVRKAGVKYDAHYAQTTVDPPEVTNFIREYYPEVIWEKPKQSMFQLIVKKKCPPTRIRRYCCGELKEIGGKGRIVITGIRHAESTARKSRKIFEESFRTRGKFFLHPIIDWQTSDVWDYILSHKLPYCELYDKGRDRIGCILCPFLNLEGRLRDIKEYPKFYRAYLRAFQRMLVKIEQDGNKNVMGWGTAEEVMHWWIFGDQPHYKQKLEGSQSVLMEAPQ